MSFADLGISKPVVGALAARDITSPFPVQQMVVSDALAGHDLLVQSPTGSGKTLAFGIPMVDRIEPGTRRLRPGPGADPRARQPDRRRARLDRQRPRAAHRRRLRRRRLRPAERRRPPRRHRRRHPGPARGPAQPRHDLARPRPRPRPRRGRPHARHGLQTGGQPDRRPDPATTARPSSSPPPWRARPASSPPPTPTTPGATPRSRPSTEARHRAQLRPRRLPERQARPPDRAAAGRRARAHARLRAHQARRRPARQTAAQPRAGGCRDARRQEPEPARTGAGALREGRRRHPDRHRRRRPRASTSPTSPT